MTIRRYEFIENAAGDRAPHGGPYRLIVNDDYHNHVICTGGQLRPAGIGGRTLPAVLWGLAGLAIVVGWWRLGAVIVNPVTYELTSSQVGIGIAWFLGPAVWLAAAVAIWCGDRRDPRETLSAAPHSARRIVLPALVLLAISVVWLAGAGSLFVVFVAFVIAAGWMLDSASGGPIRPDAQSTLERLAPFLLGIAIVCATVWHALAQAGFWRHFMLGYADFGFFTTELEYCLPYKDVVDRFADTRMGYHCIPFFYVLAPLYALFRSPVFLMVVGPLALNLAAVAFYMLARDRSGSRIVGLLVGLAWLALPSISRLPYTNTYGFQSVFLAVPWIAFAIAFGLRDRWKLSHVCLAIALLCEETACGVAAGWGLYLILFGRRRRDGAVILGTALLYLVLTTQVVIPHFAQAHTYTRVKLFGPLRITEAIERLVRPRCGLYVLALLAPLALWAVRAPRLLIAAVPTLLLVLLMKDADYLNIKYWHQSTILPVLFAAAAMGLTRSRPKRPDDPVPSHSLGPVCGLLVCAILAHQALGYSPVSRSYTIQQASGMFAEEDPRLPVVRRLRETLSKSATILATERMAAHFIDYRAVYAGGSPGKVDYIIVDRSDGWGTSGLIESAGDIGQEFGLTLVGTYGSIDVYAGNND